MEEKKRSGKYNHMEAFCLMLYRCETCKAIEVIWNSRDGVTPFTAGCRVCGGSMLHEAWQFDVCMPDYKPYSGQRVFVSITMDWARRYAEKMVQNMEGTEYEIKADKIGETLEEVAKGAYQNGEAPTTRVWIEEGQKDPN